MNSFKFLLLKIRSNVYKKINVIKIFKHEYYKYNKMIMESLVLVHFLIAVH